MSLATTPSHNILILSSDTGGGHRSAATALEESFSRLSAKTAQQIIVRVSRVLEDATLLTRNMAEVYNYLLRHRQDLMRYYFWLINHCRPNESKVLLKSTLSYGKKVISQVAPSMIVSVHPMTQHFCAYALKKLRLSHRVPLVTVVTDPCYGFWRGWACDAVQQYYVATDGAKAQLMEYGVPEAKIRIAGMPVHPKFQPVCADKKTSLQQDMGLDPSKFTLFLNAGWSGGGNIPALFESLVQQHPETASQLQVVYLTGNNKALLQNAHELAAVAPFDVHIHGYCNDMQDLMNASDVMVSKMGGLTTFEAMACHLPILIDAVTPPMPQETETVRFLRRAGAARLLRNPLDIAPMVDDLVTSKYASTAAIPQFGGKPHYLAMVQATQRLGQVGAADRIASQIFSQLVPQQRDE